MKIFYFNSSHWDREWYQPFQHFRMYLLEMAEGLLDCLENDQSYKVFCFDGQTVVLEDIIEVRPDMRERLSELVRSGRLKVGPWYVQPDEFLVSGEALIRNLLIGHKISEEFGSQAWPIGYLCDIFGHIAQMPQILQGFGIDNAVVWRGLPQNTGNYFNWKSPDGTEITVVKLPEYQGYGDFAGNVYGFWDISMEESEFKAKARKYIDKLIGDDENQVICLMDGVDHAPVHRQAPEFIRWIQDVYPESEVVFSDLTDAIDVVRSDSEKLKTFSGEMVYPAKQRDGFMNLITHTLSSYYPLKQANDQCQDDLEMLLSPLLVSASRRGFCIERNLLDVAWKYLIKNQAHDSICGCSIDQVHRDMQYRFEQVSQIVEAVSSEFMVKDQNDCTGIEISSLCHHISGDMTNVEANGSNGEVKVRFFNPLPYKHDDVKNFEIVFPSEYESTYAEPFGYETINSFKLIDENDNEIPYNITAIECNKAKRFYRYDTRSYNIYRVSARVNMRPLGWSTLKVVPSLKPVRYFTSQVTGSMEAENEYLKLVISGEGTFSVTDKRSNVTYSDLNSYIADSEIGDGWNHVSFKGQKTVLSSRKNVQVSLVEDSPERTVFEITNELLMPEEIIYHGGLNEKYRGISSSEKEISVKIKTKITLDSGSPLIQFETAIDNKARDYRLRMRIPTGIKGDYFAYQTFAFLERPAGRIFKDKTADWKEPESLEKNFRHIAGKRNDNGGIALFSHSGLHEVSACDNVDGDMYFTMLRAFRRTVATNGEEMCQQQRKLSYRYGLYFIGKDEENGEIYRASQKYRSNWLNYTIRNCHNGCWDSDSLVGIESKNICCSIIKPAEDRDDSESFTIRMVNFGSSAEKACIKLYNQIEEVITTDLQEVKKERIAHEGKSIEVEVLPHKIKTIKITLKN